MKVVAIIPARYSSTRLPGKPLADICGKPMIWWVYKRVYTVEGLNEVYVATDDERVQDVCTQYDIPVIMTMGSHLTAANRLWEVSEKVSADFYVQLNGDEPLINTKAVEMAIPQIVPQDVEFGTNIITEITDPVQVMDVSNIKVVFNKEMDALYMSRTPIPFPFKTIDYQYYKHIGIIGYNKKMLDFYHDSIPGKFEQIEGIDTLRFLDYAKQLKVIVVQNCHSLSVDTEKDLVIVRKMIGEQLNEM